MQRSAIVASMTLAVATACGSSDPSRTWDVVLSPPRVDPQSFQCTADGWAVGPPQDCPADGCGARLELVALCRERFGDSARDRARAHEHVTDSSYVEETPGR